MPEKTDTELLYRDWSNLFKELEKVVDSVEMELVFTNSKSKSIRHYDVAIRIYVEEPKDNPDLMKIVNFSTENNLHLKTQYMEISTRYIELKEQKKNLLVELVRD